MAITILYFARFRETLDCDHEEFSLTDQITTVDALIHALAQRGDHWNKVLNEEKVLIAINQTISDRSDSITDGDEVAFFPPVTGG